VAKPRTSSAPVSKLGEETPCWIRAWSWILNKKTVVLEENTGKRQRSQISLHPLLGGEAPVFKAAPPKRSKRLTSKLME
jgi:hypothetical protein